MIKGKQESTPGHSKDLKRMVPTSRGELARGRITVTMGWMERTLSGRALVLEATSPALAEQFLQATKFDKSSKIRRNYPLKTYDDIRNILEALDMS